jgi:hypothetical protein
MRDSRLAIRVLSSVRTFRGWVFNKPSMGRTWKVALYSLGIGSFFIAARWCYVSWDFVWPMLREASRLSWQFKTSVLTIGGILAIPGSLAIKLHREGWAEMKAHLVKHLFESLIPALLALAGIFIYQLFVTVPDGIVEESQKQPQLPRSMNPTVATWMITAPYLEDGSPKREVAISMPKYTPPQPARIDIVRVVPVPAQNKAKEPGLFINVYYANRGGVPAYSLIHQAVLVPSPKRGLTEAEELSYITLANSIEVKPSNSDPESLARVGSMSENELQPGDHPEHFFTVPGNDPDTASLGAMYPAFISGEQRLYIFIAVKYKDRTLPPKTVTMTEFCGWFSGTFEMWHNCGHNRVIRQSSGQ